MRHTLAAAFQELQQHWQSQWQILGTNQQTALLLGGTAAGIALPSPVGLSQWLRFLAEVGQATKVEEIILQTLLFAGFPATIEALHLWRELIPEPNSIPHAQNSLSGEQVCREVYGHKYDRVVETISRLHPELAAWMLDFGYGTVLNRPGLTLLERELGVLGALAARGFLRQFASHLEACLRLGFPPADMRWFLEELHSIIPAPVRADFARTTAAILDSKSRERLTEEAR